MKKITVLAILLFSALAVSAQSGSSEAAILKTWNGVYDAFNKGNTEAGFAYYTENALEIGPDGNILSGKSAIRQNWDTFMKMMDEKPVFKPSTPVVKMVTADVALLTWNSEDKFKIQGQEMGGKMTGFAVLHKVKGQWLIEVDAIVPVIPMPELPQTVKN